MISLRKPRGLGLYLRRLLCVGLAISMALLGFPVTVALADARIGSDTPQLLREPESVELNCGSYEEKIERLKRGLPVQEEAIRKTEALIRAAEADSRDAFERAKEAAEKEFWSILQDLVVAKGNMLHEFGSLRTRLKRLKAAGKLKGADWVRATKAMDNAVKLGNELDTLVSYSSDSAEFQARMTKARDLSNSLSDELKNLNDQFVKSGLAKDIGQTLASAGGPLGTISFKLAHLAITAGADALEGAMISKRDLPKYKENLEVMLSQKLRAEMKIDLLERDLKECRRAEAKKEIEEAAKKEVTPPPTTVTKAPPKKPAGKGPGMGTVLLIGAGAAGVAAIAMGASGGGLGGGSGGLLSTQACPSGTCENKWMSDGYILCCPPSAKYGRREDGKCYQTFADAYTGWGAGGGVLPASRECY